MERPGGELLFCTSSAKHLARRIGLKAGRLVLRRFSDGEVYCRVEEDVRGRSVWVVASTQPPGDNVLELAFLLDSLTRGGAEVNLLITYFAYARQDRVVKEGEALSSKVICDMLKRFQLNQIFVVHIHSSRIRKFLSYRDIVPTDLFSPVIRRADIVAAPDKGALGLATGVSERYGKALAYMEKSRPGAEEVEMVRLVGEVEGRRVVVVDDMISTGGTVIKASELLMDSGAKEVSVVATHGVFSGNAVEDLERSRIKAVYVTNSIRPHRESKLLKTVDLSKLLARVVSGESRA